MTMHIQPMIDDGYAVRNALADDAQQLRLAREMRQMALQNYLKAKQDYADAEAEFVAEYTYTSEDYGAAKNEKQREVLRDAALVRARQAGYLATVWRVLNDAKVTFDNADMAFEQAADSFKASRAAAELTAAALRAASV